jgi:hypothetical protein
VDCAEQTATAGTDSLSTAQGRDGVSPWERRYDHTTITTTLSANMPRAPRLLRAVRA